MVLYYIASSLFTIKLTYFINRIPCLCRLHPEDKYFFAIFNIIVVNCVGRILVIK
ncbi:hypothetical protein BX070DRAFT_219478 [Coemansia spiralis]|nr:hypothetical protein BX070DRAFT_219478 [Coemansia spiralis]